MKVQNPAAFVDLETGILRGKSVSVIRRTLGDLKGIYLDKGAVSQMDSEKVVYEVLVHQVAPVKEGGLLFGTTFLYPGKVGDEYFMTKGHYHLKRDRGEYYWGFAGQGLLLLMDEQRNARVEKVSRGSLHYVPGHTAHRLVNIGSEPLIVGACWPADAGHDYEAIAGKGFSVWVKEVNGVCRIVSESER